MTDSSIKPRLIASRFGLDNTTKALVILTGAGIIVAGYLTLKTADPGSVVCSIGGGCETVLSSQYAKIAGFPVAGLGLLWYMTLLAVTWLVYAKRVWSPLVAMIWVSGGLLFSLYLLYVSRFLIGAYCTWCLVSLGLVALISLLVFTKGRK